MDEKNNSHDFYTLKGYERTSKTPITSSMEDYLEMIYRFYLEGESIRINRLAHVLHVKPSSASKMVNNLKKQNLVLFEKYETITLTTQGMDLGAYLLFRHMVLHDFFCFINQTTNELEQVEKVEHFLHPKTVYNLKSFLDSLDMS